MQKYLVLLLAICCLSNSRVLFSPSVPPIDRQIVQSEYVSYGKIPPPINGDVCRKWIRQLPISVFDGKNWHFHPRQSLCYQRESQRRHNN